MKVVFTKTFEKQYRLLPNKIKQKTDLIIEIFYVDPFDIVLNNHALKGKYLGYRSINISGDFRIIYKKTDLQTYIFITLGNHSKLYK